MLMKLDNNGRQIAVIDKINGTTSTSLDISEWNEGEYKAVVSDSKGYSQEIVFVI